MALKPVAELSPVERSYAEAFELKNALIFARDSIDREIALIVAEKRIADGDASRDEKHRTARMRKEFEETDTPASATEAAREAIADALELLKGSRPKSMLSFQEQVDELRRHRNIYHKAVFAQAEVVEQAKNERDYRAALALQPEHKKLRLAAYRALQAAARALEAEALLRINHVAGGYSAREDLLPGPWGAPQLLIGRESDPQSLIAAFRRQLEKDGVI